MDTAASPLATFLSALDSAPDRELTDALAKRYPYFTLPDALELKYGAPDAERKAALMARVALNAADPATLFRLIDPEGMRFARFYPPENGSTPSTEDALDTFMQNYGSNDPKEQALLEKLIFNPVPDYASVLIKESEQQEQPTRTTSSDNNDQDSRLDAFLASYPTENSRNSNSRHQQPKPATEAPPHIVPTPSPDSSLSESLAKIYIKQHRYDKAYEIISQLSLNFPEKSIYFADQLRFLRKLIISQKITKPQK